MVFGSAAGASVAVGASVAGASVAGASVAGASMGASVAVAPPPHAERTMLASTSSDRKANRLRFTFLLLRELKVVFDLLTSIWESNGFDAGCLLSSGLNVLS